MVGQVRDDVQMIGRIKMTQLRTLLALNRTGSVTGAANYLGLSQPAVSRQLALLEDAIGIRLFDRKSGGKIVATPEGELLFEELESTLNTLENIGDLTKAVVNHQINRLKIVATTPVMNSEVFIRSVGRLRQSHPRTIIALERSRRENIEALVAGGRADIGLSALPLRNPALIHQAFLMTEAVSAVSRDDPLSEKDTLTKADFPRDRLLSTRAGRLYGFLNEAEGAWENQPPPAIEVFLVQTGLRFAAAGLGVSICDQLTVSADKTDGLAIRKWRPRLEIEYAWYMSKDRHKSDAIEAFTEYLELEAKVWRSEFNARFPLFS